MVGEARDARVAGSAIAGAALALVAALAASTANVAGKHAFERAGATPIALIACAFGLAALVFLPLLARFRFHARRDALPILGSAVFGTIVGPAALFAGFARTTAVTGSLLVNLETLFTALLAWFFLRERVHGREGLALGAVALGGIVVAVGPDLARGEAPTLAGLAGPALVALAAFSWSIDSTVNARLLARYDAPRLLAVKVSVGAIGLAALAWLAEGSVATPRAAWPHLALVAAFGVAGSALAFLGALRRVGATRTVVLFSTAGLWGALGARVALGEALTWPHVAGAAVMMIGVVAFAREAQRAEARSLSRA